MVIHDLHDLGYPSFRKPWYIIILEYIEYGIYRHLPILASVFLKYNQCHIYSGFYCMYMLITVLCFQLFCIFNMYSSIWWVVRPTYWMVLSDPGFFFGLGNTEHTGITLPWVCHIPPQKLGDPGFIKPIEPVFLGYVHVGSINIFPSDESPHPPGSNSARKFRSLLPPPTSAWGLTIRGLRCMGFHEIYCFFNPTESTDWSNNEEDTVDTMVIQQGDEGYKQIRS